MSHIGVAISLKGEGDKGIVHSLTIPASKHKYLSKKKIGGLSFVYV